MICWGIAIGARVGHQQFYLVDPLCLQGDADA